MSIVIDGFAILLGLVIGSFLTVLIHRYPKMLKREWHRQAQAILNVPDACADDDLTLLRPRSHCPHCHTTIKVYHNIPLFSYLFLKGRCAYCHEKIAARYPIIEILSAVLAVIAVTIFGATWTAVAAAILSWGLLAISWIDYDEHFIPDAMTFALLWIGLLSNAYYQFTTPGYAIFGAIAGYAIFWVVAKLFEWIRHKEGLGYGDFKLLAMLGAWLGITALLNIILMASLLGLLFGVSLILSKRMQAGEPLPFGPFLAFAGWCTLLFGPFITTAILHVR